MRISQTLYAACIGILAATTGTAQEGAPNLVAQFATETGGVRIQNIGNTAAAASIVTIDCHVQGNGTCPEPSAAELAPYQIPVLPNVVAIIVPALGPDQSHGHTISFFANLGFKPGVYDFTVCADASSSVQESDEDDNCRRFPKTVTP